MDGSDDMTALDASGGASARIPAGPTRTLASWRCLMTYCTSKSAIHHSPATSDLSALRVADGAVVWRHEFGSPAGPLLLDGSALYIPVDRNLTVFRATDGTVRSNVDIVGVPMAAFDGVIFSHTRAAYHPYGLFGPFQRSNPHTYLTALPASGDAPYWRVTAPALQGGPVIAT